MFWLSTTPSLLPRGPLFQGIVSGGCAALGYCLGVFVSWFSRYMLSRKEKWSTPDNFWWVALGFSWLLGTVLMFYWFSRWQNELRDLMAVDHLLWTAFPIIIAIAIMIFSALMLVGRLWAALIRWFVHQLSRIAPPRVSATIGAGIVVLLTIFVTNDVIGRRVMNTLNNTFAAANEETKADTSAPTSSLRSGGPQSLVSWGSLGREGRLIVATGPTTEQLSKFNGTTAVEPIRVYAGLDSAEITRDRAELVARELERTGAFTRKVIAIGSTTGSGWLNKATIDSLEYMYNGDTALASMQYSYLPSWLSFLADTENARQSGKALFESIDSRVRAIPEAKRPKVVVFGESLGSFGGESAFGTIPDIAARTNGALFSGPTFSNTLWNDTTRERDSGSPAWLPIYDQGKQVRFISEPEDLNRPTHNWPGSRIVYLQHASDPIGYWSPDLLLEQPVWLSGSRGRDVVGAMRWIPFVTFLQVSADMAVSTGVPDGHGHKYLSTIPYAWAKILEPPEWTTEKTEALLPLLHRD
ncbi:MAG: alpha/beta hydrolase [Mycobacteriaceae bacterium]